ncbi:MAG TPA: hypothetical protein VMR52_13060 [Dehalococcoidia bacterium]|nr:hypothetical protein [Dehalococcoidia bacterium]
MEKSSPAVMPCGGAIVRNAGASGCEGEHEDDDADGGGSGFTTVEC